MSTKVLVAKFQALPQSARQQIERLIEALSATSVRTKRTRAHQKRFAFDWAGGLEDLKDKFTSVELQHHINELR